MNTIRYVNPFSARHHALQDFSKLTVIQKLTTLFVTTIVSVLSLMFAMTPVFRALVGRFKPIDVKKPVTPKTPAPQKTAKKTNTTAKKTIPSVPNKKITKPLVTPKPPVTDNLQPDSEFDSIVTTSVIPKKAKDPKPTDIPSIKLPDSILPLTIYPLSKNTPKYDFIKPDLTNFDDLIKPFNVPIIPSTAPLPKQPLVKAKPKVVGFPLDQEIELKDKAFKIKNINKTVNLIANGRVSLKE